jgi:hypothetical protein
MVSVANKTITLRVIMLSFVMLYVVMPRALTLSVAMLNVVIFSVVAPYLRPFSVVSGISNSGVLHRVFHVMQLALVRSTSACGYTLTLLFILAENFGNSSSRGPILVTAERPGVLSFCVIMFLAYFFKFAKKKICFRADSHVQVHSNSEFSLIIEGTTEKLYHFHNIK